MNSIPMIARIAIVYHSAYGHTRRQAEAVTAGVREVESVEALLLSVEEAAVRWDDLTSVDGVIFGAPTYMAGPSAAFKAFQDATSKAVMAKGFAWKNKIAAGFTNSGARSGDKLATLIQIVLFAAQHGMHWVSLDLPPSNNSTTGSEEISIDWASGSAPEHSRMSIKVPRLRHPKPTLRPHAMLGGEWERSRFSSFVAGRTLCGLQ